MDLLSTEVDGFGVNTKTQSLSYFLFMYCEHFESVKSSTTLNPQKYVPL